MGLPESKAVSPLILGLLEDKVVFPLIFVFPDGAQYLPLTVILKGRAVSLHRLELLESVLCFPLEWGTLREGHIFLSGFKSRAVFSHSEDPWIGRCLPSDGGSLKIEMLPSQSQVF